MEYIKGKPYFCYCEDRIKQYPYLDKNLECDVVIIGGGIDGAILNYYLSKEFDVVLVDKSRFGMACTSCATALLEYQLDEFAKDLKEYMTEEQIVLAYNVGLESVERIEKFIKKNGNKCKFTRRPTFLYTDSILTIKDIEGEYEFRKENGFKCKLFDEDKNPFNFQIKSGIYAENGGGEFNPYLFAKQMIEASLNQDKIFENTNIVSINKVGGGYKLITSFGDTISCKRVVIATGFNWEVLGRDNLCERFITYSIVTSPIGDFTWYNKAMVHDANSPYHYMRLLPDNRIIFGGADTTFKGETIEEKKTNKIYDKLEKDLFKLFPELKSKTKIDYKFCGSFGTTLDNMGLIGRSDFDSNIYYFISCGANGIINAMMGVDVIKDNLNGKHNKYEALFSPTRGSI